MATKIQTQSLQAWPSGTSYRYSGEFPRYKIHEPDKRPRKATDDEARQIRRNELAAMYSDREILCCDSCLVDELTKLSNETHSEIGDAFSVDEWENVYEDPEARGWGVEECRDYIEEHGGSEPRHALNPWDLDREGLVEALTGISIECRDDETDDVLRAAVLANMDDETLDDLDKWREAAREAAQDNPSEVFEWWRVSGWLCGKLRGIGEVVIDNGYGHWWGRCCTGQGYLMDGVLQRVADEFVD